MPRDGSRLNRHPRERAVLWRPVCQAGRINLPPSPRRPPAYRPEPPGPWRFAMRRLSAIVTLVLLPTGAAGADPAPDVKETVNRGLAFLAKDNLAWKAKRQCAECHHAPFTIWALNEGKKRGYRVDEKVL